VVNFPLWRAAAIGQSGFKLEGSNFLVRYYRAVATPPFKGFPATIAGMAWARGAIFYGSEHGKFVLTDMGFYAPVAQMLPPLVIGTVVQIVNMPLVRATVTIQNPKCELRNTAEALSFIYKSRGVAGLWHGVSAGILKTVPKYVTAVVVKDMMEDRLPRGDPADKNYHIMRSAVKSVAAGIAGAVLTNPLDVLRNEMFKTDLSLIQSHQKLMREHGLGYMARGVTSNTAAVAIPIAVTIFLTDVRALISVHVVVPRLILSFPFSVCLYAGPGTKATQARGGQNAVTVTPDPWSFF